MIEKLILKYLNDSISDSELKKLSILLKSPKNQKIFKNLICDYHDVDLSLFDVDLQEDFKIIQSKIQKRRKWTKFSSSFLKYAAVLVAIIGLSYFYFNQTSFTSNENFVNAQAKKVITIEKQNGQVEKFFQGEYREITNIHGDVIGVVEQEQLILRKNSTTKAGTFHTINVPYGSKFKLMLTDGTEVYLNSGSSLRYPLALQNKNERKVSLKGEAYFKVTKNKKSPFIVESNGVFSKVLGTEFNYSAYPDDNKTNIVLVQGAVGVGMTNSVSKESHFTILAPSEKASHLNDSDKIEVSQVNIEKYIAWTQGSLVFQDDNMESILRILQRHYDVEIINKYSELNNYRFSGVFKDVKLEEILKTIQTHTPFSYSHFNNKIIIEPLNNQ